MPQKNDMFKQTRRIPQYLKQITESLQYELETTLAYNLYSGRANRGMNNLSPIFMTIKFAQHVEMDDQLGTENKLAKATALTLALTAAWQPLYVLEMLRRQETRNVSLWEEASRLSNRADMLHLYKGFVRGAVIPAGVMIAANHAVEQRARARY